MAGWRTSKIKWTARRGSAARSRPVSILRCFLSNSAYSVLLGFFSFSRSPSKPTWLAIRVGNSERAAGNLFILRLLPMVGELQRFARFLRLQRAAIRSLFRLPRGWLAKVVVTIPGDTGGTWVLFGNAAALGSCFSSSAWDQRFAVPPCMGDYELRWLNWFGNLIATNGEVCT